MFEGPTNYAIYSLHILGAYICNWYLVWEEYKVFCEIFLNKKK